MLRRAGRAISDGFRRALLAPEAVAAVLILLGLQAALNSQPLPGGAVTYWWAASFTSLPDTGYTLVAAALVLWLARVLVHAALIDRLARDTRRSAGQFLRAGRASLFPLARLLLFLAIPAWLWPVDAEWLGHGDLSPEGALGVVVGVLFVASLVLDFAAVRLVVEGRRSALFSLVSSLRFLGRHGGAAVAVHLLFFALALPLAGFALRWTTGDDAAALAASGALTLLVALVQAAWTAAQISLYQAALARPGWVAASRGDHEHHA